jgi:hypothetical protein
MILSPNSKELPSAVLDYQKKFGMTRWSLEPSPDKIFDNIVVIPAIQEYKNLKTLLESLSNIDKTYFDSTLFLFVINHSENSREDVKNENQDTLEYFRSLISKEAKDSLAQKIITSKMNIALVNASSTGLAMPDKDGGVGFARKIGMDLALSRFDYNSSFKKIIICLDADCKVEPNYLTTIVEEANKKNICAGYVEYEHCLPENEEERKAIICYEIFLRYYVLGLKYANSAYAFDSIGSTMFCDAEHYIKIGGMNKRKAAEDFYFLEKLAKISSIEKIRSTRIYPSPRKSWRVPFGTGQRINRFFAKTHDEYSLLNPMCFEVLKEWLMLFNSDEILAVDEYLEKANRSHPALKSFLIQQDFTQTWNKIILDSKKIDQISKQKLFWFDGFRTMKLIHFLRDTAFPNMNMFDALDQLFVHYNIEIPRKDVIPDLSIQYDYLNLLRTIL